MILPYTLHLGDCLEVLRTFPDNSIDSIVTDPPYGLSKEPDMAEVLRHWLAGDDYQHKGGGFMGKTWDSFVPGPTIWRECLRVLKPGGHLLAFFGSRTYDMGTLAIRLAGFQIRDMGGWLFGSGFPKSHNLEGDWEGWGSALKPAHEPIVFARKPLAKGMTLAANVLAHGTGALNIDGCRVELNGDYKCKANGRPSQTGLGDNYDPAKANQPDTAGRWPANLIHDGSDEVVELFPANAGASAPVKGTEASKASVGNVTGERERVPGAFHADSGSAARFFYCAKAGKRDRNEGLEAFDAVMTNFAAGTGLSKNGDGSPRNMNADAKNPHPTVKPTELMRYLCRLVTPPGGVVLDPFMGSGSTGKAAMREGFRFIGCELSPEYLAIAEARIGHALQQAKEATTKAADEAAQLDIFN